MFRFTLRKVAALSIAAAALLAAAGCAPDPYSLAMFGWGYWNGTVNSSTQTTCYVNGVAVDCATVAETSP